MKKLAESLELLQELDFMAGPGMVDRPDYTSGMRHGADVNFDPRKDAGEKWPYEDDGYMQYGRSMGNKGRDRGDDVGEDVSSGPPTPSSTYDATWQQDEGADWDELQRHGDDKIRNVWRDTPDGKHYTELNNEAMGMPYQTGPVAPMDGPQHSVLHFSKSQDDDDMLPDDEMRGPGNMWGGPSTIPGASGGWANSPTFGENPGDPWKPPKEKNEMKLREFFDPSPIKAEEVDNPAQDHLEDQSDEDVEGQSEEQPELPNVGGEEEPEGPGVPEEPEGDEPGGAVLMMKSAGGELAPPMGPPGMHPAMQGHDDLVDKSSAWDVLQKVVDALGQSEEEETPFPG